MVRRQWPTNGLRFAEGILHALSFQTSDSTVGDLRSTKAQLMLSQQRSDPTSELHRLIGLIDSLRDLEVLHKKFRLHVKLADFLAEDKVEVVASILEWCTETAETAALAKDFLIDYVRRCPGDLDASSIFSDYLRGLVSNSEFSWHWYVGDAPWEAKAEGLLPFVGSVEEKASCVLEVVKAAPVPWSDAVARICAEGAGLDHPLAEAIREQETMVGLKQILKRYECRNLSLSGRELHRLLQYIVANGGERGYADALEVARSFPGGLGEIDAHYAHVRHLVAEEGEPLAALAAIARLERPEMARKLAVKVMVWCEVSTLIDHMKLYFAHPLITRLLLGLTQEQSGQDYRLSHHLHFWPIKKRHGRTGRLCGKIRARQEAFEAFPRFPSTPSRGRKCEEGRRRG